MFENFDRQQMDVQTDKSIDLQIAHLESFRVGITITLKFHDY